MTLSRNPDDDVILRFQDSLNLTCTIQLDSAVNSEVVVTGTLNGPQGTASDPALVMSSPPTYEIRRQVDSLQATDTSEAYTCSVTISPAESIMDFITGSVGSDVLEITVGKKLNFNSIFFYHKINVQIQAPTQGSKALCISLW